MVWGFFKSGYQADKPTYAKTFDTLAGHQVLRDWMKNIKQSKSVG